jgi:class 3 adenylate cyclase
MEAVMTPLCRENLVDGRLKPRVWDNASIVCVDIVGFTKMSGTMQPDRLSVMLSDFYMRLDTLADAHAVYKVDIIGDAYVALGTSAADAVRFCLNVTAMTKGLKWDEEDSVRGYVVLRCAVHTGKVVGIVLNTVCFKYTLVGETIVTAKKLECSASPGQVHCSEMTKSYLDENEFRAVCDSEDPRSYIITWAADVIECSDCCINPVKCIVPVIKEKTRVVTNAYSSKKNDHPKGKTPMRLGFYNLELKN